ncbi:hypothetical protein FIBSPDRAFT_969741 [Athelia psychrophila]|uniref:CCL2-like lectin domain-containing protein n=1 Tax=Athelia psychrophila TaxID=1759441 RepID=A0A167T801_9AGAM|nr:hypothetical protein FIBSPDRAFT_969741 [Fibularhizoctonia sp. CBS 109695]
MSIPTGTYVIYNRVLSPLGEKLAITFNGSNQGATVKALANGDASQQWIIGGPIGDAQPISPASPSGLQAGWGDGVVVLPAGNYVWSIKSSSDGYTIQDGGKTQNWNLQSATVASKVAISADNGNEKYRWIFQRV